MHTLEAQTLWLLGAASAGDKEAEKALIAIPHEALGDVHRPLLTLVMSTNDKNGKLFREVFTRIFGVELKPGERCTAGIVRAIEAAEIEWSVRSLGFASMTLPKPQLIERLETLARVLKESEAKGRPEQPAKQRLQESGMHWYARLNRDSVSPCRAGTDAKRTARTRTMPL